MPVGEATVLRDRPALRLDQRLVCKYEVLSVIGKGSFSQVLIISIKTTTEARIINLSYRYSEFSTALAKVRAFLINCLLNFKLVSEYYAVKLVSSSSGMSRILVFKNKKTFILDFGAVNNELGILSRVQHPFVIRLEEVFRGASKLFIVMEMASGGEMYDRVVSKGRYSEIEARQAVRMLLNGLAYVLNS